MTTTTEPIETASPEDLEKLCTVSVNSLIIGRKVNHPIYDSSDVLLLSAGSEITEEIKQNLKQRGERSIKINEKEVNYLTLNQDDFKQQANTIKFDSELTNKLDAIVESGLLTVGNSGPSVKSNMVFLGRKGYDQDQRKELQNQHNKNGQALGEMLSEAINGEMIDGSLVSAMAAGYLKEMATDTDNVLTSALGQFQDDDLASRSLESALVAMAIGIEMGLNEENCRNLAIAGLVHDWGMMRVPKETRNAKRRLNDLELLEIKRHPIYSLELLQHVSALPTVVPIVAYQVHERFNGTGYPRGRRGHSIHQFARILQVADAFIGMTSQRSYRPPMMRYAAMECLIRMAKIGSVDPEVVRALLKIQSLFPIGSLITLSDGSVAQVLRRNLDYYTEPIVARIQDAEGEKLDPEADENIIDLHENEEITVVQALPAPGTNEIPLNEDYYLTALDAKR